METDCERLQNNHLKSKYTAHSHYLVSNYCFLYCDCTISRRRIRDSRKQFVVLEACLVIETFELHRHRIQTHISHLPCFASVESDQALEAVMSESGMVPSSIPRA